MRLGQPPRTLAPSCRILSREPVKPRSTGSPDVPPLRTELKPGIFFRKSAPSPAGTGCRGAFGSVTTVSGSEITGAVITMGSNSWLAAAAGSGIRAEMERTMGLTCFKLLFLLLSNQHDRASVCRRHTRKEFKQIQ